MRHSTSKVARRSFLAMAGAAISVAATSSNAQFGGGKRQNRGDSSSQGSGRPDGNPRAAQAPIDPVAAVERELPSLRLDLNLSQDQVPLFDSFERQVRETAEAGRRTVRHVSSFRIGEGSTATADTVLGTVADDATQRADAARLALDRMNALYTALTSDQKKQFDRRIVQSLREPLGSS